MDRFHKAMAGIMLQDLPAEDIGLGEGSHRVIGSIRPRRYRHSIRGRVSGTPDRYFCGRNQIYGIMTIALHCMDLGLWHEFVAWAEAFNCGICFG